ncbi:MAG: hypothetical protein HN509_16685 [Halobacteriovoraceae bacterium]|nr:hypothetical protein [Halobacteriovoraceae bacterium]MBT5095857.1 hypothetical protein [Halobacteriovoraceae bacterium]
MLLLNSTNVFSCDQHGTAGIVEDNNLWIGTDAKSVSTVDEKTFNKILDDVVAIYAPIIAEKGKTLDMIRKWDDGTVNAYAQQTGNTWKVSMFGGLARHETITADAFALVACHELGHHLGGFPKKSSWWGSSWASNEGQADYFGNMKCFRKYAESDDNIAVVESMNIDATATKACKANFANAEDVAVCQRGAMAGLSLGNLFRALRRLETPLKFETPDPKVVTATNHNHPAPQCRLDTYFAGAICDKDAYTDVSDSNAATGVCTRSNEYSKGIRPLCWYKPAN